MEDQFTRTRMLFGENAMNRLRNARVAVFGVGGVGGYVVEVLARSGVGELHLVDNDTVSLSNLNRQIIALHSTLGRSKVEVAEERIHDINPHCKVVKYPFFYLPENADMIDLTQMDYVVDCIDTVTAKVELISRCHKMGIPLLSCMGAANKTDATAFRVRSRRVSTDTPPRHTQQQRLCARRGRTGSRRRGDQRPDSHGRRPSGTHLKKNPLQHQNCRGFFFIIKAGRLRNRHSSVYAGRG